MLCSPVRFGDRGVGLSRDHHVVSGSIPGVHGARFSEGGTRPPQLKPGPSERTTDPSPVELSMIKGTLWFLLGAPGRTRTSNHPVKSRMLCQIELLRHSGRGGGS